MSTMRTSVAIGGPLDGVKLTGGIQHWDGRIQKRTGKTPDEELRIKVYHDGYYGWDPLANQWIWHVGPRERLALFSE